MTPVATNKPSEGADTFVARFTLEVVTKVVSEIQALRAKGTTEDDIRRKLEKDLRSYDPFTRARIYVKSLGKPIEDDWNAADVAGESIPKENTLVLKVQRVPDGVREESLVQYKGEDFTVAELRDGTVTLKRLVSLRRKNP